MIQCVYAGKQVSGLDSAATKCPDDMRDNEKPKSLRRVAAEFELDAVLRQTSS